MMPAVLSRCLLTLTTILLLANANAQERIPPPPKALLQSAFPQKDIFLPEPFNAWNALRMLYPGAYFKDTDRQLISWKCTDCPVIAYTDANGDWDDNGTPHFPFDEGVSTRLGEILSVTDSSGSYKFLSFNHSAFDEDGLQTGRFTGGLLGIAKFARAGNQWILRAVSPAIGGYGAFQQCPTVKLFPIGDGQYAFLLKHANGPGGGAYICDYVVIAGVGGRYREILKVPAIERFNIPDTESNWTGTIKTLPGKSRFQDIQVITSGDYFKEADAPDATPFHLDKKTQQLKHCHFHISTTYSYHEGKGYQQAGSPEVRITQ